MSFELIAHGHGFESVNPYLTKTKFEGPLSKGY